MRRLLLGVAAAVLVTAPAMAYHVHRQAPPSHVEVDNPQTGGEHNYTIHEQDPRVSCWHVHADGPKGRQLWVCDDH